ncbi:hypothetical protein BDZ45DRAFT_688643 [Acephala macrosclerotiorum]|nr:hypothetical protein BDZ45DRAFT_688643 [Acephala macrosclerotiorum]
MVRQGRKRKISRSNVAAKETSSKRNRNDEWQDPIASNSKTTVLSFHRFCDLPPEIRNIIFDLILDEHFARVRRNGNPIHWTFPCNAIPYVVCKHALVERNREIRGLEDEMLPDMESALWINEKLYNEFVSLRIARSELWLIPALIKEYDSHHGHYYSYDWTKLRISELDKKYLEHICFSICSTNDDYPAVPNLTYQARLFAVGKALFKLASDKTLPNISRVAIVLANQFFIDHTAPGVSWVFARRYYLGKLIGGLRSLLGSATLRTFEIRVGAIGRYTERTIEIQQRISKLLGQTVELEERGGCPKCQRNEVMSDARTAYELSMIWRSKKTGCLTVQDSDEGVEVRHIQPCQNSGCGHPMEFVPMDGWIESEDGFDEVGLDEEHNFHTTIEGCIGWNTYKGGWYMH